MHAEGKTIRVPGAVKENNQVLPISPGIAQGD